METNTLGKTSTGIEANVAALLSYTLGWITGVLFFCIEKENKFVRFHAMQSILVFGFFTVLKIVLPFVFTIFGDFLGVYYLLQLLGLAGVTLWIILMINAYQGRRFKLPILGDIAEEKLK